ncbi:MAG TPA: 16S rRNA (guanine(966)-N(2))-methyltransferase RsmD [Nitriliruptorales bacterium]
MRVIAGIAKGRRLVAPLGDDVRPTTDRTKEALFSILQPVLIGASVLDLYAGAGSLGIEALSRGAAHVTFVERSRSALASLARNLAETGLGEGADVQAGDALRFLEGDPTGAPFDIVLMDPPYGIDRTRLLQVLTAAHRHAGHGATITLELGYHGPAPRWPAGVLVDEPRRYGDTVLYVGQVTGEPRPTRRPS